MFIFNKEEGVVYKLGYV
ncbi:Protein of unknown function [Thermobacillus xylanilyticus]|uniref:Uncharacterized protein n=1 Tax=Thermobacillus xylanilyticus TaxID=76633 RepID=A0ABM8V4G9_THEXY|nr:Protein of unknown function [Thermobacillus xylanilyticus]